MSPDAVYEALRTGVPVRHGIIAGRIDQLYRSVWGDGLRASLVDERGHVWHFAPEDIELVAAPHSLPPIAETVTPLQNPNR